MTSHGSRSRIFQTLQRPCDVLVEGDIRLHWQRIVRQQFDAGVRLHVHATTTLLSVGPSKQFDHFSICQQQQHLPQVTPLFN